jgi:tetratricopeptide (TPR) repeat protein
MVSTKGFNKENIDMAKNQFAAGDLNMAQENCRSILKTDPGNADAYHLLGVIAYKEGKADHAVELISKAIEKTPDNALYYNNLGNAYVELGNYEKAIASYSRAVGINHLFGEAHYNLGNALQNIDRPDEAISSYKKAIQCKPGLAQAYYKIGQSLKELNLMELAIAALKQAVKIQENFPKAYNLLGDSLLGEGRINEAEECFKRALHFKPGYTEAYLGLGNLYRITGEIEASLAMYRKVLQHNMAHHKAYYYISSMVNQRTVRPYYSAEHQDVERIKQLLDGKNLQSNDLIYLHFALGEIYDNCDLPDEAFYHYQQGNQIKYDFTGYNMPSAEKYVNEIIKAFSPDFFTGKKLQGSSSEAPVFIVGLPRSGKSLTENLLADHNQVLKGGELIKLNSLIFVDLPVKLQKKKRFPYYINDINNQVIVEIVREYEKVLSNISADPGMRIINTLPDTVFCLGLIAVLFPHSRIIYCKRDALDNCLAIYCKYFANGNEYAFDLKEIGFYYRLYERLMGYWLDVLPLAIHEVRYENLIKEQEETAKDLIQFLRLDSDGEYLKKLRKRLTPVKHEKDYLHVQFLHDRFIGKARQYKKYLSPLEKSLKQFSKFD